MLLHLLSHLVRANSASLLPGHLFGQMHRLSRLRPASTSQSEARPLKAKARALLSLGTLILACLEFRGLARSLRLFPSFVRIVAIPRILMRTWRTRMAVLRRVKAASRELVERKTTVTPCLYLLNLACRLVRLLASNRRLRRTWLW